MADVRYRLYVKETSEQYHVSRERKVYIIRKNISIALLEKETLVNLAVSQEPRVYLLRANLLFKSFFDQPDYYP